MSKNLFLSICLGICSLPAMAQNPIVQTMYTADPAPLVHNDVLYLYTSHDEDASTWFVMNDWKLYTTTDMVNWTDHGAVLSYKTFSWAKGDAWAMQCVERDGKFYAYVPVTSRATNSAAIGVAVSDSPYGPFIDPLGKPLVQSKKGDIDPTVFIDDDGQAYLYWGNPFCYYVKLNEDAGRFKSQYLYGSLNRPNLYLASSIRRQAVSISCMLTFPSFSDFSSVPMKPSATISISVPAFSARADTSCKSPIP